MNVLFLYSGNNPMGISPIIQNQAESLEDMHLNINYFPVKERGIRGYLKSIQPLRRYVRKMNIDLIHAHYALSGWVGVLAFLRVPIIVSLMGSDVYGDFNRKGERVLKSYLNILLTFLLQPMVDVVIVKSKNLAKYIYTKRKLYIIPNGVNLQKFKPMDRREAKRKLNLDPDKKYILFLGDPGNLRKNYPLVQESMELTNVSSILLTPYPVENEDLIHYYNATSVLVLTSFSEGSPNVIKEAMACNCPIISTDVGDVREIIQKTDGCYITEYNAKTLAGLIDKVLEDNRSTIGREHIGHLNSELVAVKLRDIYLKLLENRTHCERRN